LNCRESQIPVATLQAAVNKLQPGDTLIVCGGVYRETVTFPRSGTADEPMTVKAQPGEKVIITGCDQVSGWTLNDAVKKILPPNHASSRSGYRPRRCSGLPACPFTPFPRRAQAPIFDPTTSFVRWS
jgi:hypothetical protein